MPFGTHQYCGKNATMFDYYSGRNAIVVTFTSGFDHHGKGFKLEYRMAGIDAFFSII